MNAKLVLSVMNKVSVDWLSSVAPLKSSTGVVQNANQFVVKKLPFVPVHVANQPVTASKDI